MTECELQKAQELQEQIVRMKKCVDYFSPETKRGCDERGRKIIEFNKFPFNFCLSKKSKTTANCELHIKGFFGGMSIEVDKNFVEYCRTYFERELQKAEEEFANYNVKEGAE